jgi:hypothetical protein
MKKQDIYILSAILVALVLIRTFFNIPNFNPIGAIALMGGVLFGRKLLAFIIPVSALFLGDLLLASNNALYSDYLFSTSFVMVYASIAAIIVLGILVIKKPSFTSVLGGSLMAAVIFFLISNAGSWMTLPEYPKTWNGLLAAYNAGLPFFRNTLTSQVIFSLAIYIVYSYATQRKLSVA